MAKKLVPIGTSEATRILREGLSFTTDSSPFCVSNLMEKLAAGKDREFGIQFDDCGELLAALTTAVAEINARNPDVRVSLSSDRGISISDCDMKTPLIFTFQLCTGINESQPE